MYRKKIGGNMNTEEILRKRYQPSQKIPWLKEAKEYTYTKGLVMHPCYQEHWDEIKHIFKDMKLDLSYHAPIITINELKYVRMVRDITMKYKDDEEIKTIIYPGIGVDEDDYDKATQRRIFITFLRVIPEFCRQKSSTCFMKWLDKGDSIPYLEEIFNVHVTIIDTDKQIDDIVRRIVAKT